jgi:hypothetical protein
MGAACAKEDSKDKKLKKQGNTQKLTDLADLAG